MATLIRPAFLYPGLGLLALLCLGLATPPASAEDNAPPARQERLGPPHQPAPFSGHVDANVIIGRPTASGATLSILAYDASQQAQLWLGTNPQRLARHGEPFELIAGEPVSRTISGLRPNTLYHYRIQSLKAGGLHLNGRFHTQREPQAAFSFAVTADSHLDQNTVPALYQHTLQHILQDAPDFLVDLGDTFMTDKHENRESAARQYLAQRFYFGEIGHSVPVFLALGNHDGEDRKLQRGGADSLAVWANQQRKRLFANPEPDGFYAGNAVADRFAGVLQDYYAWEWGNTQFIVLNPFWHAPPGKQPERWGLSLGDAQFHWLESTLANSRARFRVVFIHQLAGGNDRQGRGGAEAAAYGEWGGQNADGSAGLASQRPGWSQPVHALLLQYGVNIVFHGHDHLFAYQQKDGVIYQCVPQPGNPGLFNPQQAASYGYLSGELRGDGGYLRVNVTPSALEVQYIRSDIYPRGPASPQDGQVLFRYLVKPGKDKS